MKYVVVVKVSELGRVPFGYTTDHSYVDAINATNADFTIWSQANGADIVSGNIPYTKFFDDHDDFYSAVWFTTCIDGLGIDEITDFSFINGGN